MRPLKTFHRVIALYVITLYVIEGSLDQPEALINDYKVYIYIL